MVHLHKFYETSSTIYLLLQYASGGKLWDYVGAYLRYAQEQAREGGPGAEEGYPAQDFQNVYTGYKIHKDDNQRKSFTKETPHTQTNSEIKEMTVNMTDRVEFSKEKDNIVINHSGTNVGKDLSIGDFQLDSDENKIADVQTESSSNIPTPSDLISDSIDPEMQLNSHLDLDFDAEKDLESPSERGKVQYNRYTSFSSEENNDDENECSNFHPASLDRQNSSQGGQFRDLLQKNTSKPALENFSINSFDSGDAVVRIDSNVSDHIEVIHEVNESYDGEVFNSQCHSQTVMDGDMIPSQSGHGLIKSTTRDKSEWNPSVDDVGGVKPDEDNAGDIIESSKQLLRSVERTLSQLDTEVTMRNTKQDIVEKSNVCDKPVEISIYDLHRHSDTSDSQSESRSHDLELDENVPNEINVNNSNDLIVNDILINDETVSNLVNGKSDQDRSRSESESRSRLGSDVTRTSGRLSLSRLNSHDISRSASSDYDTRSPSKMRQRTISHMFEQLDLSSQNPDQVKIPESFIRRWAAEIIVALSSLHSLGIICR